MTGGKLTFGAVLAQLEEREIAAQLRARQVCEAMDLEVAPNNIDTPA
ncbi:hypothetical protein [Streptomyces sp. NPDC056227]